MGDIKERKIRDYELENGRIDVRKLTPISIYYIDKEYILPGDEFEKITVKYYVPLSNYNLVQYTHTDDLFVDVNLEIVVESPDCHNYKVSKTYNSYKLIYTEKDVPNISDINFDIIIDDDFTNGIINFIFNYIYSNSLNYCSDWRIASNNIIIILDKNFNGIGERKDLSKTYNLFNCVKRSYTSYQDKLERMKNSKEFYAADISYDYEASKYFCKSYAHDRVSGDLSYILDNIRDNIRNIYSLDNVCSLTINIDLDKIK